MRFFKYIVVLAMLVIASKGAQPSPNYPIAIHRGNGLANVFAKLNSGQSVKIAYIGGSVTQNPGWRDNVTNWFKSLYPGKITEINAGWSGTGSLIGAMRFARDVLAYNPDLVFVEFAINDLPEDPLSFVQRNSEGMVRQAWSQNAYTDICFIETLASYNLQPYLNGYYPTPVQAHYDVCDRYGLPSVNVGWYLYKTAEAQGIPWTNYIPDGAHPNSAGSQIYSDAVISYLNTERTRGGAYTAHSIPTALTDFPVTGSTIKEMVSINPLPSGWSAHYNEFGVTSFVQSGTAGSTISITFTGPSAAAKVIVSSDSGGGDGLAYSVDGGAYQPANQSVNGWTYIWAFPIAKNLANATHTVTFRVNSGVARIINVEAATTSTSGMNDSPPSGTNLAPQSIRWATDSDYGSAWTGSKAIDGVVSGTSKWVSGGSNPPHWLVLDLGGNRTVNGYIVRHAGSAGEPVSLNTRSFAIQIGPSMNGPWTDETVVDNSSQSSVTYRSYSTPKIVRYVRLYVTNPGSDNYARIPEFEVRGSSDGMNEDTPIGVNLARFATQWPTDSNYGPDWTGAKAIDGIVSGSSKWCSTNTSSTHWLALDLGSNKTVNGFIVRHAGAGGEETYYNTKNFKLQSANSINGPWTDECVVDNTIQANVTTRSYNNPKTLRYVRLYITNSGIDNYARIPEFEVWGANTPNIQSFRSLSSGSQAALSNKIVTAVFSDCFFIAEPDRTAGLRCLRSGASLSAGDRVNVSGIVSTLYGEKVLSSANYTFQRMGEPLRPLAMNGRAIQGSTPVRQGLYSTIWGRVTTLGSGYAVVDDGSGLQSSRGASGIEVRCSTTGIAIGDYVRATGILCNENVGGRNVLVMRATTVTVL